ncbi:MAG: 30S ribosomal protein S8 [Bdellovibrionales bacterium]|nr:30S ribosomal protein S8 [Bdellovibrionales bacterium]NQZ17692.1 30S ribosomal protein S8 [Bdellovibrionales bacterium]
MDTIGDFLTRIRNAHSARHEKVDIPASNVRQGIAKVLQDKNYIKNFKVVKDGKQGMMRVYLNYKDDGKPAISRLKRYSRPSRREYVKADAIPNIRAGYGMAILSTSKGIMSAGQAKENNVGGELLCVVW